MLHSDHNLDRNLVVKLAVSTEARSLDTTFKDLGKIFPPAMLFDSRVLHYGPAGETPARKDKIVRLPDLNFPCCL